MPKITPAHLDAVERCISESEVFTDTALARELLAMLKLGEYVLVPRKPTRKMSEAGHYANYVCVEGQGYAFQPSNWPLVWDHLR